MNDFLQNAVITANPYAMIAIIFMAGCLGFLIGKFYG